MVSEIFPNTALAKGKLRRETIQSESNISLTTSTNPQSQTDIPVRGDMVALEVKITAKATGTLTGANTLVHALDSLNIVDRANRSIFSKIRGKDLPMLDRYLNIGRSRTPATISGSDQTHSVLIPLNIEVEAMPARLQAVLAPYSDLATSGATGGSVSLEFIAYYADESTLEVTERIARLTQSIGSGTNRFAPNLPKGEVISDLLLKIGTESNLNNIDFSADGRSELSRITPDDLTLIDDARLVSGHVTGEFSLYATPFVSDTLTILDVQGDGSDTIEWFVFTQTNEKKSQN